MNYLRLGFTESDLLFLHYLKTQLNMEEFENNFDIIQWLYSTSGFYDKNIEGTFFNFDAQKCVNSEVFNNYLQLLLEKCKNNNCNLQLMFHIKIHNKYGKYMDGFYDYINKRLEDLGLTQNGLYRIIENKNILIVNNLGILIKQQYDSGNFHKCFLNAPSIKSIEYFNPGYTFGNNGPDNSVLDTSNRLCKELDAIINDNIDVVIVSAGCYSVLLADYIINNKHKQVLVIGGMVSHYFGISTKRNIRHNHPINEHFIEVPINLKPPNYLKVENGCYW